MIKTRAITCPFCGDENFHEYKFSLVRCGRCRIVLSTGIWEPQSNEAMEEEWFGENYLPKASVWVTAFEAWNNRKTLARLERIKPPGPRLLDIGVGSGSFLVAARATGYEVTGCDLSGYICARVHGAYGVPMHNGPLSTLVGERRFDAIVMNHVLEHVNQPVEFLREVNRLLVPGGVAHIAVRMSRAGRRHCLGGPVTSLTI